jgi:hypothetical protein
MPRSELEHKSMDYLSLGGPPAEELKHIGVLLDNLRVSASNYSSKNRSREEPSPEVQTHLNSTR